MKTIKIATLAAALVLAASPAFAYSFSFNKADAARMVDGCKDDGIELPLELAQAIVDYREANGPFMVEDDLLKVPGLSKLYLMQLMPVEEEDGLWFNQSDAPSMPGY